MRKAGTALILFLIVALMVAFFAAKQLERRHNAEPGLTQSLTESLTQSVGAQTQAAADTIQEKLPAIGEAIVNALPEDFVQQVQDALTGAAG